jgi:UDP-3-O-[3-hydroxymyristoyl] glucosamine N-acyltransferase
VTTEGVSLQALVEAMDAQLIGDGEVRVRRVRLPDEAGEGDLAFAPHPRFLRHITSTKAAAILCDVPMAADRAHEMPCPVIAAENPPLALARGLALLFPDPPPPAHIDDRAAIHAEAKLGHNVAIGPFAFVGRASIGNGVRIAPHAFVDDDVTLGDEVVVAPGAVLLKGTRVGARSLIKPGAIIGAEGFRFAGDGERNVRVPQPEPVEISDDVEVGSNATVDRGDVNPTRVGRGARIDNLAQIGHGVQIGEHAVLVGHAAIGGDTVIGDRAVLGGQAGVTPYVVIGDDARIGAKSGVHKDVPARAAHSGIPAFAHADWLWTSATLPHLRDAYRRLKHAEDQVQALTARLEALEQAHREPKT